MTALEWNLLKSATERLEMARGKGVPLEELYALELLVRRMLKTPASAEEGAAR
jgi:hypothetical protein